MTLTFQNLGIQCVRKRDAPESLTQRQDIRVDPFKQGFKHKSAAINLNAIRLCFQVFLKIDGSLVPLEPVVSEIIRDRKAHSDLAIINHSDNWSPVQGLLIGAYLWTSFFLKFVELGGKKILLFCEKVSKDDIEVHFSYLDQSKLYKLDKFFVAWTTILLSDNDAQIIKGHFTPNDVHKQYGISIITPPFTDQKITQEVLVSNAAI